MSNRLRNAFEDLIGRMEEPPSWEEITAPPLRPWQSDGPGRGWLPFAAAVAAVAVVGVIGVLLAGGERRLAAGTVPYVRIEWTQQVEMRCLGMGIEDNGGFDSATIEIWGPSPEGLHRLDATAPDGTVERQILEMAGDLPIRVWYSLPLIASEEETVFRVTDCTESGPDGSSSYSVAQPPLFAMVLQHQEFIRLSAAWAPEVGTPSDLEEFLADGFDDHRRDEWRGQTVTVFSRNRSDVDELGSFARREELWVDLENRRAERHVIEVDSEVLGRQTVTREVVGREEVPSDNVSFDPAGLHDIFDRSQVADQGQKPVTITSIPPLEHPLMVDAVAIEPEDLPTPELREAISPEEGDQLFRVPVDDFEVLVRLRAGNLPHMYATSCDVLAEVDLPDGWEGTCLERTVNGERETGTFPHGTTSE